MLDREEYQEYMPVHEPNMKVVEAVRTIMNELNGGNRRLIGKDIFNTVVGDHRTLQQNFWSAVVIAQCFYAEAQHDLRNQDSVELAQLVQKIAHDRGWNIAGMNYV